MHWPLPAKPPGGATWPWFSLRLGMGAGIARLPTRNQIGSADIEARMIHWLVPALSCIALTTAQEGAPALSKTDFYTNTVHGCHALDLSRWTHPAKRVLLDAGATIVKVELCNGDTFPVFTVTLPFDPEGHTDAYASTLYASLADANGFWSYPLVDTSADVIIVAATERRKRTVTLTYEEFDAASKANP